MPISLQLGLAGVQPVHPLQAPLSRLRPLGERRRLVSTARMHSLGRVTNAAQGVAGLTTPLQQVAITACIRHDLLPFVCW